MEGTIKNFLQDKGFGFIVVPGRPTDLFFHISEYRSEQLIQRGDKVRFDVGLGKKNREEAKQIYFIERGNTYVDRRPYYGKPTYEKETDFNATPAVIGGLIGNALFGPIGIVIGATLGYGAVEKHHKAGKQVSSMCNRCRGTGHVTNIDENFIHFQCMQCKAFWKKRNTEKLSMSNVIRNG